MDIATRFKELREQAGLTSASLAAPKYSVSYVSRIETGRRKPSTDAMAYFAKRLGVSPHYLATGVPDGLEKRLRYSLEEARRELRSGQAKQAEAIARTALDQAMEYELSAVTTRARGVLGQALSIQGRFAEAIDAMEEALEGELSPIEQSALAGALARTYASVGDLGYATELAEAHAERLEAQALYPSATTELYSVLSDIYLERGDVARAEVVARRALAGADALQSPDARADAYWQASRVLAAMQEWDEALDLVARAHALLEHSDDHSRVGGLHYAYAHLCLEAQPPRLEEAREHLVLAEKGLTEASSQALASILIERSRLALLERNASEAIALADRAAANAPLGGLELARCLLLKGRAHVSLGQIGAARRILQESARIFAELGDRKQQAACWREVGELELARGNPEAAAHAFRAGLEAMDPGRSRA